MDFWDLTKLLVRRWYFAVPLLIVSLGAAVWTGLTVQPDYVATSYVQLIPPTAPESKPGEQAQAPRNPWLSMGLGSLSGAATITVSDQTVLKQLEASGYSQNFTLKMEGQLPVVKIEVIGDTPQQAATTAQRLVKLFDDNVTALQAKYNVSRQDLIVTQRLDLGDNLTESSSKVKRALVAVAGAGLLLSAGLTIALDAWLRKRSRRRALAIAATSGPPAGGESGAADAPAAPMEQESYSYRAKAVRSASHSPVLVPTILGGNTHEEDESAATSRQPVSAGNGGGRKQGVAVEYRSGKGGQAGERVPVRHRSEAIDETSVLSMVPPDATVILPLSHNDDWNAHANGSTGR